MEERFLLCSRKLKENTFEFSFPSTFLPLLLLCLFTLFPPAFQEVPFFFLPAHSDTVVSTSLLYTDSDACRHPCWENKETAFSAEGSVCISARGIEPRHRGTEKQNRNKSRKNTSLFSCSAFILFAFKSLLSVYLSPPPPTVFLSGSFVGTHPVQRPNLQTGAIVQSG